jgi:hypothetical protein
LKRVFLALIILVGLAVASFGGYLLWDRFARVTRADLQAIIMDDAVAYEGNSIPEGVLDNLAQNRVVILGEAHFLREHRQLVAELVRELHARGFRQYLFEWTQAADWLLNDYVNEGGLLPNWTPPHDIGGEAITAIRDFNRTLPESERIKVHAIDVHLPDYGGTEGWVFILGLIAEHLPEPGPIAEFLDGDHSSFEGHQALLEALQADMQVDRANLIASWGEYWYETISEMVEVELLSIPVRAFRESDYDESVRLREEAIKLLADRRVSENPGGTLINFGQTHAQKSVLFGTEGIEWLGDYLVHSSAVTRDATMAVWVSAAYILATPGSGDPDFNLSDSPKNELLRVMNETWTEKKVFLPLEDPIFSTGRVPLNVSGDIYVSAPKDHYDAVLLLPLAHRDFVGD